MTGRRRLFVAAWPSDDVAGALGDLERPQREGVRWTTADQWHVTLRFLGGLDPAQEDAVRAALDLIDWAPFDPTPLVAGPHPVAIGRHTWALPVHGADELAAFVSAAITAAGIGPPQADRDRPFRGHLTLARTKTAPSMRNLPTPPFQSSWNVREVTLVLSTLDPTAARYQVVGTWRFDSPRA